MKEKKSKKDEIILRIIFVVLIAYNLIYGAGKFFPQQSPTFSTNFYNYYHEHKFILSAFEFVMVTTILVDTILTHDKLKQPQRFLYMATILLFVMAFIFKAFVGYMEAVFDFPS